MKKLIFVAAYIYLSTGCMAESCECGWTNRSKTRIIGGVETAKNQYPWMVAIMMKMPEWEQFCGGSIITARHVLTAGHCAFRKAPELLGVVAGEHDLKQWKGSRKDVIGIVQTIIHEDYGDQLLFNDIALLVTAKKIEFNNLVGPVCLPNRKLMLDKQYVKVMGWGLTTNDGWSSDVLREVDLRVIPLAECRKDWVGKMANHSKQLCTREQGKDSCNQDSGGPLVWMNPQIKRVVQVALVSFGDKCASPKAAVNTDVSAYMDWISRQVKGIGSGVTRTSLGELRQRKSGSLCPEVISLLTEDTCTSTELEVNKTSDNVEFESDC